MNATKSEIRFLKRMGKLAEKEARKCGLDPLGFNAAYFGENLVMEIRFNPEPPNMPPGTTIQ